MNQTVQMKLGQKEMENELKKAVEESKKLGFAAGTAEQKEYYRLANEQQSLVQQDAVSHKKSEIETLQDQTSMIASQLEVSKKALTESLAEKFQVELNLKTKSEQEQSLSKKLSQEKEQDKALEMKIADGEKQQRAADQKLRMLESIAKAK
jgi:high-affinity Fe2+/Pb2+ permease